MVFGYNIGASVPGMIQAAEKATLNESHKPVIFRY